MHFCGDELALISQAYPFLVNAIHYTLGLLRSLL
jgi:hypothetical protein